MLAAVEGSCSVPVAAWAEPADSSAGRAADAEGAIRLHGLLASGDGRVVVRAALTATSPTRSAASSPGTCSRTAAGRSVEGWVVEGQTSEEQSGGEPAGGETGR